MHGSVPNVNGEKPIPDVVSMTDRPQGTHPPFDLVFGVPHLPDAFDNAVLPVDKPPAWSSFDVVRKVRRLVGQRKVGHAGTLDPMATGLLVCLIGRATKQMEAFMGLPKTYTGTFRLGETTPSYDAETPVAERHPWEGVSDADLEAARRRFMGPITQTPPMYSAVKVGGERLYRKARRGEDVARPPRRVEVMRFDVTGRTGPDVSFIIECSKGTYLRSIAHDIGQVLGVGAHLIALRRTRIGALRVEDAWSIDALADRLAERRN